MNKRMTLLSTILPMTALIITITLGLALTTLAQVPELTEVERLRLVNAWQKAIIAQVDLQGAQTRMNTARDNWNQQQSDIKRAHKWEDATTFEINAETGGVTVHQAPAKPADNKSSQPPTSGTKENH